MAYGDCVPTFKLVVVGDENTGKTTFIKRHLTGEFKYEYTAGSGVEVQQLLFNTNRGAMRFYVWDISGKETCSDLYQGYCFQAQCAFIFFDLNSWSTYYNIRNWYRKLTYACGKIPIVICGTKSDINKYEIQPKDIAFQSQWNAQYYTVSSKTNLNFEKPFLWLLRTLVGDAKLKFVKSAAIQPPEKQMGFKLYKQVQRDLLNVPDLPDDEEFFSKDSKLDSIKKSL